MYKTPLRYPGGKSKVTHLIYDQMSNIEVIDYREPFIGGGSMFIYLKQRNPRIKKYWINDLDLNVYTFWLVCQKKLSNLIKELHLIHNKYKDGKKLYQMLVNCHELTQLERAIKFYILNRITFSGLGLNGSYSEQAFNLKFKESFINDLWHLGHILENVKITNLDYTSVINDSGDKVLCFLDPPYSNADKLYTGHSIFNHEQFAKDVKQCKHKILITYDNSERIKRNFHGLNTVEWSFRYSMRNQNLGKELFIKNYD